MSTVTPTSTPNAGEGVSTETTQSASDSNAQLNAPRKQLANAPRKQLAFTQKSVDAESSSGHTTSSEKVTSAENLEAEGSLLNRVVIKKMHGVVVLHGSGWPKRVLSSFT